MRTGIAIANMSPFVTMPLWARLIVIFYLLFYRLLFPAMAHVISADSPSLDAARLMAEALYTFLLLVPFLFYRRDFGWLHPIIFPTLLTIIKGFFKNPWHLIAPFDLPLTTFSVKTQSNALVLRQLSMEDLAEARLYMTLLLCLALAAYYAAFFLGPRLRIPRIDFKMPSPMRVQLVCMGLIGFSVILAIGFIAMQGGISKHLLALTRPRFETLGDLGPVVFLITSGTIGSMVWFAYDPKAHRNWLFWAAVLATALCAVMTTGSRSDAAMFFMMLGMIWIMRTSRIPYGTIAIIGLVTFMMFGAIGLIRRDHGAERVNWNVITSLDYEAWIKAAATESEKRKDEETGFAAMVGANRYGFLYGYSYIGATFFWIPRAIWSDKPRSTDTYNGLQNFAGKPIDYQGRTLGGKPVNAEVEAYWNFHILGTIVLFLLLGIFHKWLANLVIAYRAVPAVRVAYVIAIIGFDGTGKAFTLTMRDLIFTIGILLACGCVATLTKRPQRVGSTRVNISAVR